MPPKSNAKTSSDSPSEHLLFDSNGFEHNEFWARYNAKLSEITGKIIPHISRLLGGCYLKAFTSSVFVIGDASQMHGTMSYRVRLDFVLSGKVRGIPESVEASVSTNQPQP